MTDIDHDLLIRIVEQVGHIREALQVDRTAAAVREDRAEAQSRQYRTEIEARLKLVDDELDSLRTSRAQFYAVAATISFLVGVIIKVFWK